MLLGPYFLALCCTVTGFQQPQFNRAASPQLVVRRSPWALRVTPQNEEINNSSAFPLFARVAVRCVPVTESRVGIIPKIDACLRRSENRCVARRPVPSARKRTSQRRSRLVENEPKFRYEAVVAIARKAKQRALLEQMGDRTLDGVKPLIAQMNEELEAWEATPGFDEPRDASWPAQIGVTWVDPDSDLAPSATKVATEAMRFPGESG